MKILIILSTQRSGSTMICDDISGSNQLGKPAEYFIPLINKDLSNINSDLIQEGVNEILKKGMTENGVIAIKIMSNQIKPIGKILRKGLVCLSEDDQKCFFEYFKNAVFCRLIRNDKVEQAVSRVLARQTKVYHQISEDAKFRPLGNVQIKDRDEQEVVYSFKEIDKEIKIILKEEEILDDCIDKYNVEVTTIYYEDVVSDRGYVNILAKLLDIEEIELVNRSLKKNIWYKI